MAARIVLNDGGGPVVGSIDNGDLTSVNVSNQDNTGIAGWRWTMAYRPQGSAAAAPAGNVSTFSFTPDVRGTYLLRLVTYTDAARSIVDGADEQGYAIRLDTPFDWRVPAAGETTQFDADGGWAPARERMTRDMHGFLTSGIAAHVGTVDRDITASGSEIVVGGFVYDASRLPPTGGWLRLVGRLIGPDAGAELQLRLYDMGEPGVPVAPVLRATAIIEESVSGANVDEAAQELTVVDVPGANIGEIHRSRRVYELRAILVGTGAGAKVLQGGIALDA